MAERRISETEQEVKRLRSENIKLGIRIKELKNAIKLNENNLERALEKFMANNLLLQEKENTIRLLKANYEMLQDNFKDVLNKNNNLVDNINSLNKTLVELNKTNIEKEMRIIRSLDSIGKLKIALKAKESAIREVLYNQRKANSYISYSMGFGITYSGYGINLNSRVGHNTGIGLKIGVGILPDIYQTSGVYLNGGLNLFLYKEIYLDITYHHEVKHNTGYIYKNVISSAFSYNYFFKDGLGIKVSGGGIYRKGITIHPEIDFGGDIGIVYRI